MSKEFRVNEHLKVSLRQAGEAAGKRYVDGYASVSNVPTVIWYFEEVVAKGAFKGVLEELADGHQDVRSLFNHDANYVLGRTARDGFAATLTLKETDSGLWTETEAPEAGENPNADTVISNIKRGAVTGMSFAFTVKKQEWEFFDSPDGETLDRRTITEVGTLYDVGPVTYPAYAQTSVGLRARNDAKKDHDEARSRWQTRQKSKIIVPREFEHSLFEMRSEGENWVDETIVAIDIDETLKLEATPNEEIKEQEQPNEAEATKSESEVEPVESTETEIVVPTEDPIEVEPAVSDSPVEEVDDSEGVAGEARRRQIEIKRRIFAASRGTRNSLK